jgi:hypothetical protein
MTSSARREASRKNGRQSRGPKTAEGLARSQLNALKHGLSRPATLTAENSPALLDLARSLSPPGAEPPVAAYHLAVTITDLARVKEQRRIIVDSWRIADEVDVTPFAGMAPAFRDSLVD